MQKTSTGQPARALSIPSPIGGADWPVVRTTPASTRPISVMNRPMPAAIADFSPAGTAWKIARRKPVSTRTRMTRPSSTISPIASAQVMSAAIVNATNAFRPSPAASASGKFATTPIRIVTAPATNAVAAATMTKACAWSEPPPI